MTDSRKKCVHTAHHFDIHTYTRQCNVALYTWRDGGDARKENAFCCGCLLQIQFHFMSLNFLQNYFTSCCSSSKTNKLLCNGPITTTALMVLMRAVCLFVHSFVWLRLLSTLECIFQHHKKQLQHYFNEN